MKTIRVFGTQSISTRLAGNARLWSTRLGGLREMKTCSITTDRVFDRRPASMACRYDSRSFATSIPRTTSFHQDSTESAPRVGEHDSKPARSALGTISAAAALTGAIITMVWALGPQRLDAEAPVHRAMELSSGLQPRKKVFRLGEVRDHGADSDRPWVIKGNGVYDITDWIESHPGGTVILRAAGSGVEPYWDIFSIHKNQDVHDILEQYRIGDVDPRDLRNGHVPSASVDNVFRDDPVRDPSLLVLTERPCNAETPPSALASFITKTPYFYVRNHLWVPRVDPSSFQLTIDMGNGSDEKTYTLADLRTKFPQHTITAVLQCSGNRRRHMSEGSGREANGLKWGAGAISNAEWRGPRLRDVLRDAGLDLEDPPEDLGHAQFTGQDAYGASIPLDKVIDRHGDVLLACEMNGEELSRDHGYPVRVLVPGITGARSVKWVNRITLSDEESTTQWQRRDYKCFGPNESRETINWDNAPAIQETPVQSAITSLRCQGQGQGLDAHPLSVEGYAFSGGGRKIIRVDVSVDGGRTWDQAEIQPDQALGSKAWSWTRWKYQCNKRPSDASQVVVKAVDEAYNVQPESHASIFNFRGNLANAWHRVRIGDYLKESLEPVKSK